jgi:hypothetical protein
MGYKTKMAATPNQTKSVFVIVLVGVAGLYP